MPACIRVDSGISVGTRHWIDRPVLRIGSDPQCDICLPSAGLAAHALTIEFREGVYRAYNRDATVVSVGSDLVKPGGVATWHHDATLVLPGDLRLVLEVDGDPRPAPRPESLAEWSTTDSALTQADASILAGAATTAGESKKSSSLGQLAVIGICIATMAGLLTMRGGSGERSTPARPTFDAIVEASLARDDSTREIVRRLQYAQAALVRGHNKLARVRFLKLRDQLVHTDGTLPAENAGATDDVLSDDVLSYVEYQLGRLE